MDEVTAKKVDDFFKKYKYQAYKKGEILIRADENPQGVLYLKGGIVKQYAISRKGDELIINIFRPISFFPMSWAINKTPNNYYYEAMTNLNIWRAPSEDVVAFIKSNPDILYDLMSRVYRGTEGMLQRMTYLMGGNAYARLVIEIIIQAKRFGKNVGNRIELKIAEKDLASQSGMTRETVSREIKLLKNKKLVVFTKNVLVIADIQKLEDELIEVI